VQLAQYFRAVRVDLVPRRRAGSRALRAKRHFAEF
jgi:hypothetical protein